MDKDLTVLNAIKVGGSPMMIDAWTAKYSGLRKIDDQSPPWRLFVYIKCDIRGRLAQGTYVYEIAEDLTIAEKGIVFDKGDLEAEKMYIQRIIKERKEKYEHPNQALHGTAGWRANAPPGSP